MTIYVCENTIDCLLSALFISFIDNEVPAELVDRATYRPRFDAYIREIQTNKENNIRVKNALCKYGGKNIISHLTICLYSCDKYALTAAFNYAHLTLDSRKDVSNKLSHKSVSDFSSILQKVLHERYSMTGFLRFKESFGGVMYTQYSPDNDLSSLLAPHFFRRFRQTPFILHDTKRNKLVLSNGKIVKIVCIDFSFSSFSFNEEENITLLWEKYFNSTIKNERLYKKTYDKLFSQKYKQYAYETWE